MVVEEKIYMEEKKAAVEVLFKEIGFDCTGECEASQLRVLQDVRDMCRSDLCRNFGKSWSCPPACGSLDQFQILIDSKQVCLAFQTVMQMEDSFDIDAMIEAAEAQAARIKQLSARLRRELPEAKVLGSGTCVRCAACAYPDSPCRFPEEMVVSMEAAGLLVSEVCKICDIPYNHGENTICYTGCVLL